MARIPTICPFCGCGCNFYLVTEQNRVVGVEPSPGNPVNKGMLCAKVGIRMSSFILPNG